SRGREVLLALVQTIEENKAYLSEIDGAIGDGDHGINMAKGFRRAKEQLGEKEINLSDGLALIGKTLLTEIGGAMGPIYGTFFLKMSMQAKDKPEIDTVVFGQMLKAARSGVEELAGAKVGDKTILDTLAPAQESYQAAVDGNLSFEECLAQMVEAAKMGKESTRGLVAKLGRASRLGERSKGVLDAGATSCCLIVEKFAAVLRE
ncbi:MAG: dihydroxyacetone kinase subunit L, partial [Verrucomicrobia bacterium]|nr:dihydroxyacetone kinase subunit L [Verrucomicrobiota bacterium]